MHVVGGGMKLVANGYDTEFGKKGFVLDKYSATWISTYYTISDLIFNNKSQIEYILLITVFYYYWIKPNYHYFAIFLGKFYLSFRN